MSGSTCVVFDESQALSFLFGPFEAVLLRHYYLSLANLSMTNIFCGRVVAKSGEARAVPRIRFNAIGSGPSGVTNQASYAEVQTVGQHK